MSGYLITRILNQAMPDENVYAGGGRLNRLMRRVNEYRMRRKTIAALNSLDDYMLADIGITRNQITKIAGGLVQYGNETAVKRSPELAPIASRITVKMAA